MFDPLNETTDEEKKVYATHLDRIGDVGVSGLQ